MAASPATYRTNFIGPFSPGHQIACCHSRQIWRLFKRFEAVPVRMLQQETQANDESDHIKCDMSGKLIDVVIARFKNPVNKSLIPLKKCGEFR
jgi:hypothetical protein